MKHFKYSYHSLCTKTIILPFLFLILADVHAQDFEFNEPYLYYPNASLIIQSFDKTTHIKTYQLLHFDELGILKSRTTTISNKNSNKQIYEEFFPLYYHRLLQLSGQKDISFFNIWYSKHFDDYFDNLPEDYFRENPIKEDEQSIAKVEFKNRIKNKILAEIKPSTVQMVDIEKAYSIPDYSEFIRHYLKEVIVGDNLIATYLKAAIKHLNTSLLLVSHTKTILNRDTISSYKLFTFTQKISNINSKKYTSSSIRGLLLKSNLRFPNSTTLLSSSQIILNVIFKDQVNSTDTFFEFHRLHLNDDFSASIDNILPLPKPRGKINFTLKQILLGARLLDSLTSKNFMPNKFIILASKLPESSKKKIKSSIEVETYKYLNDTLQKTQINRSTFLIKIKKRKMKAHFEKTTLSIRSTHITPKAKNILRSIPLYFQLYY